jgi:hypothetical protein
MWLLHLQSETNHHLRGLGRHEDTNLGTIPKNRRTPNFRPRRKTGNIHEEGYLFGVGQTDAYT